MKHLTTRYALPAALLLGGGMPVGFILVSALDGALPGHRQLPVAVETAIGLIVMFSFAFAWGHFLARATGAPHGARLAWASALTYTVTTLALVLGLGLLEILFVEQRALGRLPIHIIFAILFTPAAFIMAAVMSLVAGTLLRGRAFALQLAWRAGLAAALTFLAADIIQDLLGRRVGGPNAAATLTMISVTVIGNLLAGFAAGLVIGRRLEAEPKATAATQPPTVPYPSPTL